jgi:hypothetical protein
LAAFFALYNRIFIDTYKYQDIYIKFKDYSKNNKKKGRDLFLSFSVMLGPYVLMIIYAVLNMSGILP